VEWEGIRRAGDFGKRPGPAWHGSGYRWKSGTRALILPILSATGRDFVVGPHDDDGDDDNGGGNGDDPVDPDACAGPGIKESFAGVVLPGGGESVFYTQTCPDMSAQLTYNPGNSGLSIALHDADGNHVADAEKGNGRRITVSDLAPGEYEIRIQGDPAKATDYVVQVRQKD
jgi:hypothetical protein